MVSARAYSCGAVDKSRARLFVAGGFNNKELNSVEIFDLKTERWIKAPEMPTARTKSGGAVIGDYFAVVGNANLFFIQPFRCCGAFGDKSQETASYCTIILKLTCQIDTASTDTSLSRL